jgi:surface protein
MNNMFAVASNFNQNIGNWNVGNLLSMGGMFTQATKFNQNIGNWNVSNVTNMTALFRDATIFNQNIGNWNVSNVTLFALFMAGKTALNFSAVNLDAIYNGWSSRPVKTLININFNTIKHTASSNAGRAILTGAPNNWAITDGGI